MRTITLIIVHCSATPEGRSLDFEACRRDHIRHRHFRNIGYHYYLTRDGTVHPEGDWMRKDNLATRVHPGREKPWLHWWPN